jgi:hypothetical protein
MGIESGPAKIFCLEPDSGSDDPTKSEPAFLSLIPELPFCVLCGVALHLLQWGVLHMVYGQETMEEDLRCQLLA